MIWDKSAVSYMHSHSMNWSGVFNISYDDFSLLAMPGSQAWEGVVGGWGGVYFRGGDATHPIARPPQK